MNKDIKIYKSCFIDFMNNIKSNSVNLILTDPPYNISKETGFKKGNGPRTIQRLKIDMDFGKWDHKEIDLKKLCNESYRVLTKGGTAIIFYDLWKISILKKYLEDAGFKQIRLIIWEKSNPVPINSKINYLTNSREIAVLGIKHSKPTFHSSYDNGVYKYPIEHSRKRFHPTQKPLMLFNDLINKHSNKRDLVIDPFLGSGTSAVASVKLKRRFQGCDIDYNYIEATEERLKDETKYIQRTIPRTS